MAITYTQLTQAIIDFTESNETTFVSNIPIFIRQAEHRIYNSVQLPVQRKTQVGNLTLGNRFLSVPSDFLSPYALAVVDPSTGAYSFVLNKDVSWIREAYPDPVASGKPEYYGQFNDQSFLLSRTPDYAYQVELNYFYYPQSIVDSGTETTWLGDNYDMALLYACLVEAYSFLKGEQDLLVLYDTKFKEALGMVKRFGDGLARQDEYRSGATRVKIT